MISQKGRWIIACLLALLPLMSDAQVSSTVKRSTLGATLGGGLIGWDNVIELGAYAEGDVAVATSLFWKYKIAPYFGVRTEVGLIAGGASLLFTPKISLEFLVGRWSLSPGVCLPAGWYRPIPSITIDIDYALSRKWSIGVNSALPAIFVLMPHVSYNF